jgi:ABC-type transport system substrate-binding protein
MWMSSKPALSLALTVAALVAVGCSSHQSPPATPADAAKTPTFRSSTNSFDQPNSPLYTQPGVNPGSPAKLASIPPTDRFDQNTPLASEVYGALQGKLGAESVRYVSAQSKGATVLLEGTASSRAVATHAFEVAKTCAGVKNVVDRIEVQPR